MNSYNEGAKNYRQNKNVTIQKAYWFLYREYFIESSNEFKIKLI